MHISIGNIKVRKTNVLSYGVYYGEDKKNIEQIKALPMSGKGSLFSTIENKKGKDKAPNVVQSLEE